MSGVHVSPASDGLFGFDPDDGAAQQHLSEVVRCLPMHLVRGLMADIIRFERGGDLSETICDALRRAACLADAERIFARLQAA